MKRGLIVGLVVVLIVAAILGFRIFSQRPSETGQIPVAVQPALQSGGRATAVVTEEPQFQHIEEILKLHGKLEAARRVDVIPKAAGQITAVYHSVGDRVNRGDLLVQLETEGLELQLQQAEAALEAAQANLQRTVEGARPEEIEQAEAVLAQAQASLANVQLVYARSKRLYQSGVLSGQEWDSVQAQYKVAVAQERAAAKSLELVKQGAREADIAAVRAQVRQAEVAVAAAQLQLDHASVTAPVSGTIAAVNAEVGAMAATMPVVTILDLDNLKIELNVGEREIVSLAPGQEVRVQVATLSSESFPGVVDTVYPAADPVTGLFKVEIQVDNSRGLLKPGMYATVSIVTAAKDHALTIPSRAVVTANGVDAVYVVIDERAVLTPVTLGLEGDGVVELLAGVGPDTAVVVSGQDFLADGDVVRPVERGDLR